MKKIRISKTQLVLPTLTSFMKCGVLQAPQRARKAESGYGRWSKKPDPFSMKALARAEAELASRRARPSEEYALVLAASERSPSGLNAEQMFSIMEKAPNRIVARARCAYVDAEVLAKEAHTRAEEKEDSPDYIKVLKLAEEAYAKVRITHANLARAEAQAKRLNNTQTLIK